MNGTKAIKEYFGTGKHGVPVTAKELLAFRNSDIESYTEIGRLACEALGEPYEDGKVAPSS